MTPDTQELVKRLRSFHSKTMNEAAAAIEALSMDSVSEGFLDVLAPSPDGTEWMDPNKRRADRAERVAAKIEALTLALQQETQAKEAFKESWGLQLKESGRLFDALQQERERTTR